MGGADTVIEVTKENLRSRTTKCATSEKYMVKGGSVLRRQRCIGKKGTFFPAKKDMSKEE